MDISRYRRKNQPHLKNKLGHNLYEPTSRQVLYDKKSKRWIPYRKRCFHLWFKFLQHCERDENRTVNWKKYRGWGGRDYILSVKFDEFWKDKYVELFSVKERGDKPKFTLSTPPNSYESWRVFLLVYEYTLKYPDKTGYEISRLIQKRESLKRFSVPSLTLSDAPSIDGTEINRTTISRTMSKWRKRGREIMDNVCEGQFP